MPTVEDAHQNLPARTRHLFQQAYELAQTVCPAYPLTLIRFTAQHEQFVAESDRIHAIECTDPHCPAFAIQDQLQEIRRLLVTDREPDLQETIRAVLAAYQMRQTIAAHLGPDGVATVVNTPNKRFRWRLVWRGATELSEETYPTRREAERALAEYLRG
jgi:hypothetical protein